MGRGGRCLVAAVNVRGSQAIYVDVADLAPTSPRRAAVRRELEDGGFLRDPDVERAGLLPPPIDRRLAWRGADRFVRRIHDHVAWRLFRRRWFAAQLTVAVFGALAIVEAFGAGHVQVRAEAGQIPIVLGLGLVAVLVHEFGHAVVTVHFGRHVRIAGVRLHLGAPSFYVESLDALLLDRRQRLLQAAAGPWAEWLFTSVAAAALICLDPTSGAAVILQRFVVLNTIVIVSNLLPFAGLDGALLLADAVGRPDLPFHSSLTVAPPHAAPRWVLIYRWANVVAAAGLLTMAGYFWWQLFGELTGTLWRRGPAGMALLTVGAVVTARHVPSLVAGVLGTATTEIGPMWSRLVFRCQRRWRVQAINASRGMEEFANLSPSELGIVAGLLQRHRRRATSCRAASHFYVRRGPCWPASGGVVLRRGMVAAVDGVPPQALTGRHEIVTVPLGWQSHIGRGRGPTVSVRSRRNARLLRSATVDPPDHDARAPGGREPVDPRVRSLERERGDEAREAHAGRA